MPRFDEPAELDRFMVAWGLSGLVVLAAPLIRLLVRRLASAEVLADFGGED